MMSILDAKLAMVSQCAANSSSPIQWLISQHLQLMLHWAQLVYCVPIWLDFSMMLFL